MSRLAWLGVMAIVAAAPDAAHACSVCIGGQSADTTLAYRAMTAFMTFTPMAIVGGVVYWIHRRFKALDSADEATRTQLLVGRTSRDVSRG